MDKIIETKFKKVFLCSTYAITIHFIKKEFDAMLNIKYRKSSSNLKIFKSNKDYNLYYSFTIDAYNKANMIDSNFKIIDLEELTNLLTCPISLNCMKDDVIITKSTRYGDNVISLFYEEKIQFCDIKDGIISLIKKQRRLNLYHLDFALRNICISTDVQNKDLFLIDFDNGFLNSIQDIKDAKLWLNMLYEEICLVTQEDKNITHDDIIEMFRLVSNLPNWDPN